MAEDNPKKPAPAAEVADFEHQIVEKIGDSENILVALSRSPSVDEMAAAIGLTMFLNRMGKHVTAIYSGETPNALEFLKPEGTFEDNTNSLQDFIIALNKEKADHLRYKLDGDYVKIYITPYRTTITKDDLEFARGDYNVDLVVALNVPTASDLDTALNEHGRIMHDASAIDITTGEPGKFGEIEWSDKGASSVSEMVGRIMLAMADKNAPVTKEEATALMTGIMAATQRFSNEKTTPGAMSLSSKLMELGADQKLIANNIENQTAMMGAIQEGRSKETGSSDPTLLDVREEMAAVEETDEGAEPAAAAESPAAEAAALAETPSGASEEAVSAVATQPEATPVSTEEPLPIPMPEPIEPTPIETSLPEAAPAASAVLGEAETVETAAANTMPEATGEERIGTGVTTESDVMAEASSAPVIMPETIGMEEPKDYGAMIDAALAETVPTGPAVPAAMPTETVAQPVVTPTETVAQPVAVPVETMAQPVETPVTPVGQPENPAAAMAPAVPVAPEENHIPEMDYNAVTSAEQAAPVAPVAEQPMPEMQPTQAQPMQVEQPGVLPMPDGQTLPPPPTPPVDFGNLPAADAAGAPVLPEVQPAAQTMAPVSTVGDVALQGADVQPQSVAPSPVPAQPQPTDPGAFRIPGM